MPTSSMAAIGEKLKAAREKKSLTIDQVQKQTRIHSAVIAALEDGRCNEMLSPTYVKSFLKKYSNFLGLDAEAMVEEYGSARHDRPTDVVLTLDREDSLRPDMAKIAYIAGISLIALAFLFFLFVLGRKIVSSSAKPGARTLYTTPRAKGRSIPARTEAPARELVSKGVQLSLVLKVKQPLLVKAKKDGVKIFERVLPRGTVETIKANERIDLYVAKAEAIELILNGKSLGSPGRGVIKDLEITRKGIRIK